MSTKVKISNDTWMLLDKEDFLKFGQQKWTLGKNGYAYRRYVKGMESYLHRLIMNPPKGMMVDHINGNRLDNRKSNLRICTSAQNAQNCRAQRFRSSIYKGVYWSKVSKSWVCQIKTKQKPIYIGLFKEQIQAAMAYDLWAKDLFKEYAKTNFKCLPN